MKRQFKTHLWAIVCISVLLILVMSASAQKAARTPSPPDTAINPHDFTNQFYADSGINAKEIIGRRTGTDWLSVFGWSSDANHSEVRVVATIPGYDKYGQPIFWYPLGEVGYYGFTDDIFGEFARQTARQFPIYVFPDRNIGESGAFTSARQAPLFDDPGPNFVEPENPVGIRQLLYVSYTEKAFSQEGQEMMDFLKKKNGIALDDTPMIKTRDDLNYLLQNEFVRFQNARNIVHRPSYDQYVLSPIIAEPRKGAIAKDAFVLMTTTGGAVLPSEEIFVQQFACLRESGDWCL